MLYHPTIAAVPEIAHTDTEGRARAGRRSGLSQCGGSDGTISTRAALNLAPCSTDAFARKHLCPKTPAVGTACKSRDQLNISFAIPHVHRAHAESDPDGWKQG